MEIDNNVDYYNCNTRCEMITKQIQIMLITLGKRVSENYRNLSEF